MHFLTKNEKSSAKIEFLGRKHDFIDFEGQTPDFIDFGVENINFIDFCVENVNFIDFYRILSIFIDKNSISLAGCMNI